MCLQWKNLVNTKIWHLNSVEKNCQAAHIAELVTLFHYKIAYRSSRILPIDDYCDLQRVSIKVHHYRSIFFLLKLYVSFEKSYNNMIDNIICFHRIFVLCNLDDWFRNYGKSCEVPPNLSLVTTWVSVLKTNNSEQHKSFLTKVAVIIHVLIQFYIHSFWHQKNDIKQNLGFPSMRLPWKL